MTLATTRPSRARVADPAARIARIACALVALALPALGTAAADALRGAGRPVRPLVPALSVAAATPVAADADHGRRVRP